MTVFGVGYGSEVGSEYEFGPGLRRAGDLISKALKHRTVFHGRLVNVLGEQPLVLLVL